MPFGGFGGRIGMDSYHRLLGITSVLIKSFVSNLSDIYSEHQIVNWCNQYKYNIFGIFDCKFQNSRPKCGRDSVWHKMHKPQTENICTLSYSKRLLYIHETSYCLEVRKSPFWNMFFPYGHCPLGGVTLSGMVFVLLSSFWQCQKIGLKKVLHGARLTRGGDLNFRF